MTIRVVWTLVALCLVSGCSAENELTARYKLEREYYEARQLEQQAYATYPVDAYQDWLVARDAYIGVLLSNPANIPESAGWDPQIVATMEGVALAAEIGLLRLDVVDYQFHDSVTHATPADAALPEVLGRVVTERMTAVYDSLGEAPEATRATRRLRAVVSNPVLWTHPELFRDSLLAAPHALSRCTNESSAMAEGFYSRVIASWPDSAAASRARDYRSRVLMARGEMEAALADVEVARATHPDRRRRDELELTKADLLGFSLRRIDAACSVLRGVIERDPGSAIAWSARIRLALWAPPPGVTTREQLRMIHMDDRAPYHVAAAALFARAMAAEREGDWRQSQELYWRLTQRFPNSTPALATPLHVIRALLARGDRPAADAALTRAIEYYSLRISRDSAALVSRHLPKDCLLEACLLLDRPEEAVTALQNAIHGASGDNRVASNFKVAVIETHRLENFEIAVEILEKSLELFPGSRYLGCTRWKLQRTREARDG